LKPLLLLPRLLPKPLLLLPSPLLLLLLTPLHLPLLLLPTHLLLRPLPSKRIFWQSPGLMPGERKPGEVHGLTGLFLF
jgi:hypothetical protein